ncbi:hypothetical protein BCR44DRAFT_1451760 [Catenaria anguillulae PL171]|uniref:Uncharacterized protein n=1 Tax=Catenaria anguillulae PL171 TaxID=765915 RepID=A0A1Y2H460_9FUNG|nr:hypothetical protein BCR44DRAFT_1451760 [Catenaria anguillulae PL171]
MEHVPSCQCTRYSPPPRYTPHSTSGSCKLGCFSAFSLRPVVHEVDCCVQGCENIATQVCNRRTCKADICADHAHDKQCAICSPASDSRSSIHAPPPTPPSNTASRVLASSSVTRPATRTVTPSSTSRRNTAQDQINVMSPLWTPGAAASASGRLPPGQPSAPSRLRPAATPSLTSSSAMPSSTRPLSQSQPSPSCALRPSASTAGRPPTLARAKRTAATTPPAAQANRSQGRERIGAAPAAMKPNASQSAEETGEVEPTRTLPRHLQEALPYAKAMILTHEAFGEPAAFGKDVVAYIDSLTQTKPLSKKMSAKEGLSLSSIARSRLRVSISKPARSMEAGIHSFALAQELLDQSFANQNTTPTITKLHSPAFDSEIPLHSYTNLLWFAAKLPDGVKSQVIVYVPGLHQAFIAVVREFLWGTSSQANALMMGPILKTSGAWVPSSGKGTVPNDVDFGRLSALIAFVYVAVSSTLCTPFKIGGPIAIAAYRACKDTLHSAGSDPNVRQVLFAKYYDVIFPSSAGDIARLRLGDASVLGLNLAAVPPRPSLSLPVPTGTRAHVVAGRDIDPPALPDQDLPRDRDPIRAQAGRARRSRVVESDEEDAGTVFEQENDGEFFSMALEQGLIQDEED